MNAPERSAESDVYDAVLRALARHLPELSALAAHEIANETTNTFSRLATTAAETEADALERNPVPWPKEPP